MRPRPTDYKTVSAMLEEPAEDADELAKRIVDAVYAGLADRRLWVLGVQTDQGAVEIHGPYSTANQALKDAPRATPHINEGWFSPYPLLYPTALAPASDPRFGGRCPDCKHALSAHGWHRVKGSRKILKKYKITGCMACECEREEVA